MKREFKIGLTGIVALVLLFLGIKFLKGVNLFKNNNSYYIVFANAKGLTKSSTVYADGFNIGIVDDISYLRPGEVVVRVNVDGSVKIPIGTTAHLDEAMLGGCTLNMVMGPDPENCFSPGDTIAGSDVSGLMDAAAGVIPQVQVLLDHIDSLVLTLNTIASSPDINATLQNARELTAHLNESTVQLNSLLNNDVPEILSTFNKTGQNLDTLSVNLAQLDIQSTLDKVDSTLDNLHEASQKLYTPDNNVGLLLSDTSLYGNLNNTINSATLLLEDMKAHPGRYINISVFGRKNKQ
ncbi:MAG: MlaD family protein [Prevotellaceae bacterium]|nr:MlaD family protein [Prevotellaceae bacterium]